MAKTLLKYGTAVVLALALLVNSGCCRTCDAGVVTHKDPCRKPCKEPCPEKVTTVTTVAHRCPLPEGSLEALPTNARPGECWAKVVVPPTYRTVTERVMVKPARERVEVIPAEYRTVEERVCVKDETKEIINIPAEYGQRQRTVVVEPARTGWEINKDANCELPRDTPAKDVFCLVEHPPVTKTVTEEYVVKPARCETRVIPAEYETVRKNKLVRAASTRKVCEPAEFANVEKRVLDCDSRIAWQRVICEEPGRAVTLNNPALPPAPLNGNVPPPSAVSESPERVNAIKSALLAKGYAPGPLNGEIRARDWVAINKFQKDNNLPIGGLNPETMRELGV